MNRLNGKVALITGGGRGMGAVEAELFVRAGAKVVITDVAVAECKAVADAIGPACTAIAQDVSSEADWARVMSRIESDFGQLDVLVNNAGIFRVMGLENTSLEDWNRQVAINQTGTFLGIRSAVPLMKAKGAGSIINLS
ncbi:MAG: SDR family NAD(P)-dependent oxidoreductase, partial [Pseudomonadota bacterium]